MKRLLPLAGQVKRSSSPLLSICCVTYNHEPFIARAITSFLMQKVNFSVEIIIHDDASNDKTGLIVSEFALAYPGIIKAIVQSENQFSRGVNTMRHVREMAKGKYVALCEGDDYWGDDMKLAKQVQFLENNPSYVMAGHQVIPIDRDGRPIKKPFVRRLGSILSSRKHACDLSPQELKELKVNVPTNCRLFRNIVIDYPAEIHAIGGDAILQSVLGAHGSYKFLPDIKPSFYTKHSGGIWSSISQVNQRHKSLGHRLLLRTYYEQVNDMQTAQGLLKRYLFDSFRHLILDLIEFISQNPSKAKFHEDVTTKKWTRLSDGTGKGAMP